jgi:hypothetical protein
LPTGLSLSNGGGLSGTPTQTGTFPITVGITDGNGCTGTGSTYTLVISCQTITITNPVTAAGTVNTAFNQAFIQTGGVGGATFTLNSGTLPAGLSLSTAGVLSGTPTQTGSFPITVGVTDGNGCTGSGSTYTLVINPAACPAITVNNPATTSGAVNVVFNQVFAQTGAVGGATFALNSGILPAGLTLSPAGVLSGTPTQAGNFPIVIKVTDGNGCEGTGNTYSLVILPATCATVAGTISSTVTAGQSAVANSVITFSGSGGVANYTFTYNISVNGGPVGATQSVSTTGGSSVVYVAQSNAVLGTYRYNLLSVTDANGCVQTPAPAGFATVTIIVGSPDLANSQFFTTTQVIAGGFIDEVIAVRNVGTVATSGPVVFSVTNYGPLTGLSAVSNNNATVTIGFTTYTLDNSNWTITSTPSALTFTSNPGVTVNQGTTKFLGVRINRAGGANGSVTHSYTIVTGTGGGEIPGNNTISNTLLKN